MSGLLTTFLLLDSKRVTVFRFYDSRGGMQSLSGICSRFWGTTLCHTCTWGFWAFWAPETWVQVQSLFTSGEKQQKKLLIYLGWGGERVFPAIKWLEMVSWTHLVLEVHVCMYQTSDAWFLWGFFWFVWVWGFFSYFVFCFYCFGFFDHFFLCPRIPNTHLQLPPNF